MSRKDAMNEVKKVPDSPPAPRSKVLHAIEGIAGGALAGAAAGAIAGPPGSIAGAVLGAAAGAVAEQVLERESEAAAADDRALDEAVGVNGGDMGAPNLRHPPARAGAYSAAASGAGVAGSAPTEGPIPSGDADD